MPIVLTDAWAALLLDQVPPVVRSETVVTEPTQKALLPKIDAGSGLMVTVAVTAQPVGNV